MGFLSGQGEASMARLLLFTSLLLGMIHTLSAQDTMYARYSRAQFNNFLPFGSTALNQSLIPGFGMGLNTLSSNGVFGRAWVAPPKVPMERVTALRAAMWKAFNDPEAQAKMRARKMRYDPVRWEVQQKTLKTVANTPKR